MWLRSSTAARTRTRSLASSQSALMPHPSTLTLPLSPFHSRLPLSQPLHPSRALPSAAGDAGRLYDSVHSQLLSLPPDTLVFPAHDYKGNTASSVGEEAAFNARLTKSRDEFIQLMAGLNLPRPKQIDRAVPANLECGVQFPYA